MGAVPRLADVQCSRLEFQPGDRVIVKLRQRVGPEEIKKIRKTVERWAGGHVEVLVVDLTMMEVEIDRAAIKDLSRGFDR